MAEVPPPPPPDDVPADKEEYIKESKLLLLKNYRLAKKNFAPRILKVSNENPRKLNFEMQDRESDPTGADTVMDPTLEKNLIRIRPSKQPGPTPEKNRIRISPLKFNLFLSIKKILLGDNLGHKHWKKKFDTNMISWGL